MVDNQQLLNELKERIMTKQLSEEEIFQILEKKEIIADCEIANLSELTNQDWRRAFLSLEKDQAYQKELELWDSFEDE